MFRKCFLAYGYPRFEFHSGLNSCEIETVFIISFQNYLRRGTLQQKSWFSRTPPTNMQIHFREKIVKNLNTTAIFEKTQLLKYGKKMKTKTIKRECSFDS